MTGLRRIWYRLRLWVALWRLTADPICPGVVLALRYYRRHATIEQEAARRAEAVAWTLAWARRAELSTTADRVRYLVDLLAGLEACPTDPVP